MQLIPLPQHIIPCEGIFSMDHNTAIHLDAAYDDFALETAKFLQEEIQKILSIKLPVKILSHQESNGNKNCIYFELNETDSEKETYHLTVTQDKITIAVGCSKDFLYGMATLVQLCKTSGGEIGCVHIIDHPSYSNRGYLLDVSRGRVPSLSSLKAFIDKLSLYKINQLQLYMESSLRLDGFEEVWSQTDPWTQEEILELDRYCHLRGIELVPCIATFGHLYDLLRSVSFKKYREIDSGQEEVFAWHNRMRHYTINVADPGSLLLITGMIDQYLPLFRSKKINICCDETFELGKGRSAELAEKMTYGELYFSFVDQLIEHLQSKGKEVMLWGDVLHNNPDIISRFRTEVTCLNWYYDSGAKEETVKIFSDKGLKQYVCPSVSGHNRLVNAYDLSFSNIREMALLGKTVHAEGVLNTDWGDCGGINMPALSIPCMIYGAAQSWNVDDHRAIQEIDQLISSLEYKDQRKEIAGILRELSHHELVTIEDLVYFRDFKVLGQTYELCGIWMHETIKTKMMQISEDQLKTALSSCADIMKQLKINDSITRKGLQQETTEFYLAVRGVALVQGIALIIKQKEYGQDVQPADTPWDMARKMESWIMDYCQAWRGVSRESELYRIREFIRDMGSILRKY